MNRMKMLAFLSAACLTFTGGAGAFPLQPAMTVFAEDTGTAASSGECGAAGDNLKWEYDGNGTLTISGSGAMKNYSYSDDAPWKKSLGSSIKTVVMKEGVTSVGAYAFYSHSALEQVTLPESLTEIGDSAFSSCRMLKSISVPAGVEKIGSSAFGYTNALERIDVAADNANYCSVDGVFFNKAQTTLYIYPRSKEGTSYVIPDTVTYIDFNAFYNNQHLKTVTIPESVTGIGSYAFDSCAELTELAIPSKVTLYTFSNVVCGCPKLEKLTVSADNASCCAVDNVLFMKDMKTLLCYAAGKPDASYTVPDTVTNLSKYAFSYNGNLKEVTLPSGVKELPDYLFQHCDALEKVTLPDSITEIGRYAFGYCKSLSEIVIPAGVTKIGSDAFYSNDALTEIDLPVTVEEIESYALSAGKNLESVTIRNPECKIYDSASTISKSAVIYGVAGSTAQDYAEKYNREFMEIGETALSAASGTFGEDDCLKWEYDGDGTLTITGTGKMPNYAEEEYSSKPDAPWKRYRNLIQHAVIGAGVQNVGAGAFYKYKKMTDISLPDTVEDFGSYCFSGCASLQKLVIPAGVTELENGYNFVTGCTAMTAIEASPENPAFTSQDGVLYTKDMTGIVRYPVGKSDPKVTIPEGVTSIWSSAFTDCLNVQTIRLPDSIESVTAVYGCKNQTAFEIGESNPNFSVIDGVLFSKDGKRLVRYPLGKEGAYVIPDGTTALSQGAFAHAEKLTEVYMPDSLANERSAFFPPYTYDYYLFDSCTALTSVRLPDGIRIIPHGMFAECSSLKSVTIPDGVTDICAYAFSGCRALSDIKLPESLLHIWNNAFSSCGLRELTLPAGIAHFDSSNFGSRLDVVTLMNPFCYIKNCGCKTLCGYRGSTAETYAAEHNLNFMPLESEIPDILITGDCGANEDNYYMPSDSLKWSVSKEHELIFTGTGEMMDYFYMTGRTIPWDGFGKGGQITHVVVSKDVPTIAHDTFYQMEDVIQVTFWNPETDIQCYNQIPENVVIYGYEKSTAHDLADKYGYQFVALEGNPPNLTVPVTMTTTTAATTTTTTTTVTTTTTPAVTTTALTGECGAEGSNVTWTLADGVLTISGNGAMKDYQLTSSPWYNSKDVQRIVIEDGVTHIGDDAFNFCENLTEVSIPASVTNMVAGKAFYACNGLTRIEVAADNPSFASKDGVLFSKDMTELHCYPAAKEGTSYVIPDSVKTIKKYAFMDAKKLTEIKLPDGLTSIEDRAFFLATGLKSVSVPDTVTNIGAGAFQACRALTEIAVGEKNPNYCSADGVLYSKDKTVIVAYPAAKDGTEYTIPDGVTTIACSAFYDADNLSKITIPDGVTLIESDAFFDCEITEVTLPNTVTEIKICAFTGCNNLTEVILPESVLIVGTSAFSQCRNLASVTVKNPNCNINDSSGTFNSTAVIRGYADSTAQAYAEKYNRKFELLEGEPPVPVTTPAVTTTTAATTTTTFTTTTTPAVTTTALTGECGAEGSNVTWTLADGVLTISGKGAMKDYSNSKRTPWYNSKDVQRIIIEDGVTYIGDDAFGFCENLTEISIPASLTSMDAGSVFYACDGLTKIEVAADNPSFAAKDGVLFSKDMTELLRYPAEEEGTSYVIPDSVKTIKKYAFMDAKKLTEIKLPDGLTSIEDRAFFNDSFLITVSIPDSVENIGNGVFIGCLQLNEISVGEKNPNYCSENGVLYSKDKTVLVAYPAGNDRTEYTIPDGVTTIADSAFYDAMKLTKIAVPDGVLTISEGAFNCCFSLSDITLPESLTEIGNMAFNYCSNLEAITIPGNVKSVGSSGFGLCQKLTAITFENPNCEIYDYKGTIPEQAVIRGYADSTAQAYAEKYNRTFELLEGEPPVPVTTTSVTTTSETTTSETTTSETTTESTTSDTTTSETTTESTTSDTTTSETTTESTTSDTTTSETTTETTSSETTSTQTTPPETTTTPTNGDTDGDGEISNRDAMLLIRYVNGWDGIELDTAAADIDGDGEVSNRDAMILIRYVNGWEGYDQYFQ